MVGKKQHQRLRKFQKRKRREQRKVAMSPEYLEYTGDQHDGCPKVEVILYGEGLYEEHTITDVQECLQLVTGEQRAWVRVVGLHDVERISSLLNGFGVHPLLQADILNVRHRPKVETSDDSVLVIQKMVIPATETTASRIENLSLLLLDGVLISFQETCHEVFEPVMQRLGRGSGRLRSLQCDYLMWALLDAVTDHFLVAVDAMEHEFAVLDDQLLEDFDKVNPKDIYQMRHDVSHLGRVLRPSRELVTQLEKADSQLITPSVLPFLRDLYDHTVHVNESVEQMREMSSSLRDFYMNSVNIRMNEVMKVLTCFSSVFLPLGFLAGVYGMNFERMPELSWPWAYPCILVVFVLLAGGMIVYFRRRRWL